MLIYYFISPCDNMATRETSWASLVGLPSDLALYTHFRPEGLEWVSTVVN